MSKGKLYVAAIAITKIPKFYLHGLRNRLLNANNDYFATLKRSYKAMTT